MPVKNEKNYFLQKKQKQQKDQKKKKTMLRKNYIN